MKEKILITSALPYANGPLHFGHIAGAYLPGDCYARFERLLGNDVLYICGSDEYGIAITLSAELAGRSPQEHVDKYHKINQELFQKLNFSFDHFSRTTWEGHKAPVQQFFLDLLANGYIEAKVTNQLYSPEEKRFLADRYVVGTCPKCGYEKARGDECLKCGQSYEATDLKNPRSKLSGAKLELKPTKHWFLLLDKFKDKLLTWIETKNWKPNVLKFVKHYIEELRPRAITRDMEWGVPVPLKGTEGKVLYVWFDAPIGYISATMQWALKKGDKELWKKYWLDEKTKLVNFIGKDNIPFHAVIFPAMCMGQNLPIKLVDELPANEFYKLEGRQFSKSEGWFIDLDDFFKRYSSDQIRYVIASNAPETSDSEFTWKDFQNRCNAELLGKYGNLVNRTLVFAQAKCDKKVPQVSSLEKEDKKFLLFIEKKAQEIKQAYQNFRLRRACRLIMELAQEGNAYFDIKKPWVDAKSEKTVSRMHTTIFCCLECIKVLALVSFPVIPNTAEKIWKMLGNENALSAVCWETVLKEPLKVGTTLPKPEILFQKIEDKQIEEEIKKLHQMKKQDNQKQDKGKQMIDFEDFQKMQLRVGLIKQAEKIEKSKKLLKLQVDIGGEVRQIVSGISQYYSPEDLLGKKVVVVVNLKPVKIMGVESQGMILAASNDQELELVQVDKLSEGATVS